jgi:hypothetical protein
VSDRLPQRLRLQADVLGQVRDRTAGRARQPGPAVDRLLRIFPGTRPRWRVSPPKRSFLSESSINPRPAQRSRETIFRFRRASDRGRGERVVGRGNEDAPRMLCLCDREPLPRLAACPLRTSCKSEPDVDVRRRARIGVAEWRSTSSCWSSGALRRSLSRFALGRAIADRA